jgi:transposase-like protein
LLRSAEAAKTQWRKVADRLRPKLPKLAGFMDEAETDVLAYMGFPAEHWPKIHSTNGLELLNGEVKRRTDVVGIFPNDAAITRLVGAVLLEQNDEWAVQRARYMTLETMAALSDARRLRRHEGIKAAVAKLMNATWLRCRVHTMRNALAHAGKSSRRVVSAFIATAFAQER